MANIKQNRIEIRGLTDDEINYLKSLAKKIKPTHLTIFCFQSVVKKLSLENLIVLKTCMLLIWKI